DLGVITLRASKTGSPPGDLILQLRDVIGVPQYVLDQSQTSYDGDRQIYGDNWSSQLLQAGLSGELPIVTLRASKTGNPSGDLFVELRDVVEGFQDTLDQSQTSYDGDRQVYGDNWSAQLFQAGASGNLGVITLRASKAGSPPNDMTVELRNVVEGFQDTLDQSQTSYDGDRQVYGDNWSAQIFQAGSSGDLPIITLRASKTGSPPNDLTLELRNVAGETFQDNLDQSQTSYDGDRQIYGDNWSSQLFQAGSSGDLKVITLRTSKSGSPPNDITLELRNVVEGLLDTLDQSQTSYDGDRQIYGDNWSSQLFQAGASGDLGVITLRASKTGSPPSGFLMELRNVVEPFQDTLDQNQNSYTGDRQIYGDNWSSQLFQAGSSGELPMITLRASKTGNPTGDLFVELRNVVEGFQDTLDQSQTTYTGDRQVYGDNWSAQLFQAGSSGELPIITLRTSKTGSPPNDLTLELRNVVEAFQDTLDQSQTSYTGDRQIYGDNWSSQNFQAGSSGELSVITLRASKSGSPPNDLTLELRNVVEGFLDNQDQSQTTYDNTRQVYGDNWSSQTFQAGLDGYLECIDLRTSKTGSPPGDLTVELRDAVEVIQDTLDQSQTSYDGDRQIYGNNWSSQLFQAGLDGYLGVITLRASKSGSPPGDLTVELRNVVEDSQEILDQTQTARDTQHIVYGNNWVAQTFQVDSTGTVPKVALWASRTVSAPPNALVVELQGCTVGDLPDGNVLATASRSDIGKTGAEYEFIFSTPPSVTAGTKYSIVAYTIDGTSKKYYQVDYYATDGYANGRKCDSTDGGSSWLGRGNDQYFKIYITETGNVPGSTVHATTSRSDITTAGDYDFTFATPYSITSGTEYAIVAYTSGGDASNYYTAAYNSAGGYASGRESSSTDGGSNWTLSDSTDLYFKTYIREFLGKIPGSTTYATASRSDITTAGHYEFTFGSLYAITSGTDYAMVIYTSGGDASNYYTVAYNSVGGYANGREISSTDAGSNWTPSDSTDLYFETCIRVFLGKIPGSTVHATTSRGDITTVGDYDFTFTTPYSITSGTDYAIVICTSGGDGSNYYTAAYNGAGGYADGRECSSTDAGFNWTGSSTDLYFKTYIRESIGNIPGSTVHATTSRSDITTVGDYDFTFATPYSVISGTKYAIVIYTSLGDASNYYTVAYNSAGGYASGRECSSTDAGSNWTGSDTTDIYFMTYIRESIGNVPGSTVYATTSRSDVDLVGNYSFTFATPYSVTSGTDYAIVVRTPASGGASKCYNVSYYAGDVYANGRECSSTDAGSNWTGSDVTDLYFKTYIREYLGKRPGSTVYATTSRSDITTAGDYDFTFATPYSISSGNDYAIVIYTSGGDASNYYTAAYNSAGGYANGRECSSTDGGSNWTGSDATDLYFKTYIRESLGNIPGSTVYATTSRSDITTAGDYDFTFATPYTVSSGTDYAMVIYTSGGDASTNYYTVAYNSAGGYASGRECSSTDGGSNWTGSDTTDLYFKTYIREYIGKRPGSTVYATTSRSDITTAGDYDFTFATPYSVSSGTDYSIV
ncbi:hypothetical protein ACFLXE_07670, partial [Chloroflexota bacterium]